MSSKPRHWNFVMKSEPCDLRPLRESLSGFLNDSGLSQEDREKIQIVMGEACTNSIRHSYHEEKGREIRIEGEDAPDKITFKIRDFGSKIDLSCVKKPQLPPKEGGGLGIYFMQTMMDEFRYNTDHSEGNELILVKYKKGKS